jgi:multicomponent Na+:H+ antiporter subunit E
MNRSLVFQHPVVALARALGLAIVWLILVGPDAASWIIGGPFVIGATLASLQLATPRARIPSLPRMAGFIPYFLRESLKGGIDVAARVLFPRMRVQPGHEAYRLRLRSPESRLVFVDSISLLPGTLSADLRGDLVTVHALDVRTDVSKGLAELEERVAALFGEALEDSSNPASAEPSQPSRSSEEEPLRPKANRGGAALHHEDRR